MALSIENIYGITSNDESVVKAIVFNRPDVQSKQIEDIFQTEYDENRAIRPPLGLNPEILANTLQLSTRLSKLIRTLARNTVGLGWSIEPKHPPDPSDPILDKPVKEEIDRVSEFFHNINPFMPFNEICECVVIDRETTGNGYYEIVRNIKGQISSIFHVPSTSIRILSNGEGFVQIRKGQGKIRKVFFKNFGDPRVMDSETGELYDNPRDLDVRKWASEILHRKIHHPVSEWYGIPRWLTASPAIAANRQAQVWNLNFIMQDAHWPVVVSVENGELSPESVQMIRDFIERTGKGLQGNGRVLVLQAQKKHPAYRGPETHINVTPLHVGVQDDGSFLKLRSMNDEEIRECFGIAPLYLGSANDLNRASAAVARIVTNEQEFIPMILSEEHVINATIMKGLGAKYSVFRFRRPKTTDALQDAQVLAKLNAHVALSINQIISLINRLIPGSDIPIRKEPWANIPIKILELNKQGNVDNNIDNEVKNILMDIKDKINDTYDIDNPM